MYGYIDIVRSVNRGVETQDTYMDGVRRIGRSMESTRYKRCKSDRQMYPFPHLSIMRWVELSV